ncbi:MAG: hypothetical protein K2L00_08390 [Muribaculaceae bacterium]|nr:hypothetical protein [Muribaculaceae bacterium]
MLAAMAAGVGIVMGGNTLCGIMIESNTVSVTQSGTNNVADSIADIIQEMKNGDRSRTKSLAEAYRYGRGVEKSMLNAMICYQMAEVDFESMIKKTYEENPDDEFASMFTLMNMYDRHYKEDAGMLLSEISDPVPAWATMMRKILDYKGDDINGYILSLVGPESSGDECFVAFGCILSNNKTSNDSKPMLELANALAGKVPYFYNMTAQIKLDEYKGNPARKRLLTEVLMDYKKANDAGFLSPRSARRILENDFRKSIDVTAVFSPEELEQLKRLGASTSSGSDNSEATEAASAEEVVELIDSVTIEEAFNLIGTLDGFMEVKNVGDFFNFPEEIGKPTMILHVNSEHRDEILWFMDRLPEGSMVYDDTDEQGKFDRMFLDGDNNDLLYVHVGLNGNDTALVLIQGGNRRDIDKFIEELNGQ